MKQDLRLGGKVRDGSPTRVLALRAPQPSPLPWNQVKHPGNIHLMRINWARQARMTGGRFFLRPTTPSLQFSKRATQRGENPSRGVLPLAYMMFSEVMLVA